MPFQLYAVVALGGALGTIARYFTSGLVANAFGETFPWGTLIVNVVGSFIVGFFWTLTAPDGRLLVSGSTRQFVMTGFCGGFTTFSSFSLQTMNLMNDGEWLYAGGNVLFSVALCLVATWLGFLLGAALTSTKGHLNANRRSNNKEHQLN